MAAVVTAIVVILAMGTINARASAVASNDGLGRRLLNNSEMNAQANAVRRQGVDETLIKYAAILVAQSPGGNAYDIALPASILHGIHAKAIILERAAGVASIEEFSVPANASFDLSAWPSSDHVLLLYRRIPLDFTVYTLPPLYRFLGAPVGLLAFPFYLNPKTTSPSPSSSSSSASSSASASASAASPLPYLPISLSFNTSIHISLPFHLPFSSMPSNSTLLCAFFSPDGSIFASNLSSSPNHCSSQTLGDFALIAQTSTPSPPSPSPSAPSSSSSSSSSSTAFSSSTASVNPKLVIAAICIAVSGLAFVVALALISIKLAESMRRSFIMASLSHGGGGGGRGLRGRSRNYDDDETLQMSLVGQVSRAPSAAPVRTKPKIEMDMANFSSEPLADSPSF